MHPEFFGAFATVLRERDSMSPPATNGNAPAETTDDALESVSTANVPSARLASSFTCNSCGKKFVTWDDVLPLYECSACGWFTIDTADDSCSTRCPNCNRFCFLISEQGCPVCKKGELEKTRRSLTP